MLFGNHASQMLEVFWEALEHMLEARLEVMKGSICPEFMPGNAEWYAQAVQVKCHALEHCVGFTDAIVVGIARPKGIYHATNCIQRT